MATNCRFHYRKRLQIGTFVLNSNGVEAQMKGTSMKTDLKGSYAQVNGINLYYEVHGNGEPLILLHGGVGAIEMFDEVLPLLAAGRQVIAADLQAHGRTTEICRCISLETMA